MSTLVCYKNWYPVICQFVLKKKSLIFLVRLHLSRTRIKQADNWSCCHFDVGVFASWCFRHSHEVTFEKFFTNHKQKLNLVAVRRSRPGILPLKNTVVNFVEVILKFFNIRKPLDRYNVGGLCMLKTCWLSLTANTKSVRLTTIKYFSKDTGRMWYHLRKFHPSFRCW